MKPTKTKESQLDIITRHVADMHATMATKDDLKGMATKDDLKTVLKKTEKKLINRIDFHFHSLDKDLMEDRHRLDRLERHAGLPKLEPWQYA